MIAAHYFLVLWYSVHHEIFMSRHKEACTLYHIMKLCVPTCMSYEFTVNPFRVGFKIKTRNKMGYMIWYTFPTTTI